MLPKRQSQAQPHHLQGRLLPASHLQMEQVHCQQCNQGCYPVPSQPPSNLLPARHKLVSGSLLSTDMSRSIGMEKRHGMTPNTMYAEDAYAAQGKQSLYRKTSFADDDANCNAFLTSCQCLCDDLRWLIQTRNECGLQVLWESCRV